MCAWLIFPEKILRFARGALDLHFRILILKIRLLPSRIKLKKITRGRIPIAKDDLLLFACVRNELPRIPFFLEYYRSKGVDRFFFIDNNSSDGTAELLLSQTDTCVFKTNEPYSNSRCGLNWLEILLNKYGHHRWCLLVDLDEFFVYPYWEKISIKGLCSFLDNKHLAGLKAMILDMYADGFPALPKNVGQPPWEVFNYFDKASHYFINAIPYGGVRSRVFHTPVNLQKIPLLKYSPRIYFASIHSLHNLSLPLITGVLLHFKFDSLFRGRASLESKREEHWNKAEEYKAYSEKLNKDAALTMYSPEHSVKFGNSHQLVKMELMKTSEEFENHMFNGPHHAI